MADTANMKKTSPGPRSLGDHVAGPLEGGRLLSNQRTETHCVRKGVVGAMAKTHRSEDNAMLSFRCSKENKLSPEKACSSNGDVLQMHRVPS